MTLPVFHHLTEDSIAAGFNLWLGEYIENPDAFTAIQDDIDKSIAEATNGEEPSYGARCAATLIHYLGEPQ